MNSKNIQKALNYKLADWVKSIDDKKVQKIIEENAIITGGAIVSLLQGEEPNDYDIYFKSYDSCLTVCEYYVKNWNETHDTKVELIADTELFDLLGYEDYMNSLDNKPLFTLEKEKKVSNVLSQQNRNKRISMFIRSKGAVVENGESVIDDNSEPTDNPIDTSGVDVQVVSDEVAEKPKYRPRYFSSNAISLSDKIQIVIRFYGDVTQIHQNYDFVHCTCSYDFSENKVNLPVRALEAIINKELYYTGSKYPLCSIIRSRKFIQRGWSINAGQYLKMCLQLNELDLKDLKVFKDQLTGVDSAYFEQAISYIQKRKEEHPELQIDNSYLFEVINKIF